MAIKESVTIEDVINLLNEAVAIDPDAMGDLIAQRVRCGFELADHPTIQVGLVKAGTPPPPTFDVPVDNEIDRYLVGFLGMLNGIFGSDVDQWGAISAVFDDDGVLVAFKDNGRR